MLSKLEYDALIRYRDAFEVDITPPNEFLSVDNHLLRLGYIYAHKAKRDGNDEDTLVVKTCRITVKGKIALSEFEDSSNEKAKAEKQQRFDNKISVASILVPAFTFLLGLFVEHYGRVLGLILPS